MQKMKQDQTKRRGLKVVSVVLSILLWFYVVNQGELTAGQNSIDVELQYYNVPDGIKITGPSQVSVRLWGVMKETGKITAYVDLEGLDEGTYHLPVKVEPVTGAMFTSVQPQKVDIVLEKLQEHIVPVNYQITRNPPAGYDLLDLVIVPEKCVVKGEESNVGQVTSVVAQVDLSNIQDISSLKVKLLARDVNGKLVSEGINIIPEKVAVYAVVSEKKTSKEVPVTAATSGQVAEGYNLAAVNVEPATALILGNETILQDIESVATEQIDLNEHKESFHQQVKLAVPEGSKVYPETVTVLVDIIENLDIEENNGD